jgi:two-component system, NarL family, nitrate/nitrite response regulator NarL
VTVLMGSPAITPIDNPAPVRTGFHIHLLIADEVVRRGIEALTRTVPGVAQTSTLDARHGPRSVDAGGNRRVLIMTPREAGDWLGLREELALLGAKTVLLLPAATDLAGAGSVPADGFLVRDQVTAGTLTAALDQLASGTTPMPAALARLLLAREPGERRRGGFDALALTPREQATVVLLAQGLSNRLIGRRLGISENGAKRLVASILIKLDAPNRTAAVVTALRRGLLTATL